MLNQHCPLGGVLGRKRHYGLRRQLGRQQRASERNAGVRHRHRAGGGRRAAAFDDRVPKFGPTNLSIAVAIGMDSPSRAKSNAS
jgi:hypothetical protein